MDKEPKIITLLNGNETEQLPKKASIARKIANYVTLKSDVGTEFFPIFSGNVDKLKSPEECVSPYEAIGTFWAQMLLGPSPEDFKNIIAYQNTPNGKAEQREVEKRVGGFAKAIEYLARQQNKAHKGVDHFIDTRVHPDDNLKKALKMVEFKDEQIEDIGLRFPSSIFTRENNGVVTATYSFDGEEVQLWPVVNKDKNQE